MSIRPVSYVLGLPWRLLSVFRGEPQNPPAELESPREKIAFPEAVPAKRLTGIEAARALGLQDQAGTEVTAAKFGDMLWDEMDHQR